MGQVLHGSAKTTPTIGAWLSRDASTRLDESGKWSPDPIERALARGDEGGALHMEQFARQARFGTGYAASSASFWSIRRRPRVRPLSARMNAILASGSASSMMSCWASIISRSSRNPAATRWARA